VFVFKIFDKRSCVFGEKLMIDQNVLNARNDLTCAAGISLHAQPVTANTQIIDKKERADLRLSFLILKKRGEI
jgi:hypothetical protein